jgi:hypothetical protein
MKKGIFTKALAMLLVVLMFAGTLQFSVFAVSGYDESKGSNYYNVISQREWDIAPPRCNFRESARHIACPRR